MRSAKDLLGPVQNGNGEAMRCQETERQGEEAQCLEAQWHGHATGRQAQPSDGKASHGAERQRCAAEEQREERQWNGEAKI